MSKYYDFEIVDEQNKLLKLKNEISKDDFEFLLPKYELHTRFDNFNIYVLKDEFSVKDYSVWLVEVL